MNNVVIIMRKQWKDTLKNPAILIQFVLFPALGIVMTKVVKVDGMPAGFFADLFAAMYVGMAPLVSISSILSEEKEKNTLRVLMMADVKPWQYLLGIGSHVFFSCMAGSVVFCWLSGKTTPYEKIAFLLIMSAGILASLTLGAAIGVGSRSQMSAESATVPVMLVFSFLPMLSMFNETIAKAAKYIYSEQIRILIGTLGNGEIASESILVILVNMIVSGVLFGRLYQNSMQPDREWL